MMEGEPPKVQHNSGTLPGDHQGFFLSCSRKANKPYICGRIKKKIHMTINGQVYRFCLARIYVVEVCRHFSELTD